MSERPYLSIYSAAEDESAPNHVAACWESPRVQRIRFDVLADLYPLAGKVVLDAGCSRGDFARFLIAERIGFARYIGIDALPAAVAHANRLSLRRCEFYTGDLLDDPSLLETGPPDVICISGTLNTLTVLQARSVLESAWRGAREALLFNFLSDRVALEAPVQTPPIRRLPTLDLLAWAFEKTSRVAFRQDYLPRGHDATIRMVKETV